MRVAFDRLRRRLDSLVSSVELGGALQEPIVTLRNGRYVVPVRADAKGRVKGIVHDSSGSGQTLFIEPLVIVELGNAWREAQLAEQEEVERILDELSTLIGANAGPLRETLGALARFDLWFAKAQLAGEMRATRAETSKRGDLELLSARHPGLDRPRRPDRRPARRRLHGPRRDRPEHRRQDRHAPDPRAARADAPGGAPRPGRGRAAGCRCSRTSSPTSATSSRSPSRSRRSPATCARSSGSPRRRDPERWSCWTSWARARTRPRARPWPRRCWTTSSRPGPSSPPRPTTPSSRPTPTRRPGRRTPPSSSTSRRSRRPTGSRSACPAARRPSRSPSGSGCPRRWSADAKSRLSESQRTFEATLARIREVESETAESKERAREAELRAGEALRAAAEERRRAQQSRADTERIAREEAERLVAELRVELEAARTALERGHLTVPGIDAVLERADQRLASASTTRKGAAGREQAAGNSGAAPAAAPAPTAWRVGDEARSVSGGWTGRIAELDKGKRRATLEAGALRVSVDVADLERAAVGASSSVAGTSAGTNVAQIRSQRAGSVPLSLDLRGARVEEALTALERYLEDASLAGLAKVNVIHGLGTGALRDAVRSDAAAHPLVRAVRAGERGEGGDGVTVVDLG